jgi:signal peptidase I
MNGAPFDRLSGWRLATDVVKLLFASHMFVSYGYELRRIDGLSMFPLLNESDDYVLTEKWTYLSKRGFKSGDVVLARNPYTNRPVCKRIIAKVRFALNVSYFRVVMKFPRPSQLDHL